LLHEVERIAAPRRAENVEAVVLQLSPEVLPDRGLRLGDLLALEHGPPLRVVDILPVPAGASCVPVLARVAAIGIAAR
jgi:hypothetical protein